MCKHRLRYVVAVLGLLPTIALADCWQAAAERYGVTSLELAGIACVESRMNPDAYRPSANGEPPDHGMMQINASHLPALKKYGIREEHLKNACVNVMLGAWVLASTKAKYGDSWEAVGAYNAACTKLHGNECTQARANYAWKVMRAMTNLQNEGKCGKLS